MTHDTAHVGIATTTDTAPSTDDDIVILTDLRFPGGTSSSLAEEIVAATAGGYSVAVLHMASTRLGPGSVVHGRLRELLEDGTARLLMPGEAVNARLAIVKHPTLFAESLGGPLPITVDNVVVIALQVPHDGAGTYYDAATVTTNVTDAVGQEPTWWPASPHVRASLAGMKLSADDWTEVIDVAAWRSAPTAATSSPADQSPAPDARPLTIGRHSRPHPLKWPGDPDELRSIYPTDGSVTVRVLGGADAVVDVIGEVPPAWEVLPFGAIEPAEFLAGLDAFVYFHHRDLAEAFGRTILEALAADVPVIVGHHFEATFGDACLYADPDQVIDVARALIDDPDALAAHSATVTAHLDQRFSHEALGNRLAGLAGPPSSPPPASPARVSGEVRAVPDLRLVPPGLRAAYPTTLVTCLGADLGQVDELVLLLDRQRRLTPGFIPIVVHTTAQSSLAAELGIETAVVMSRRRWAEREDDSERWEQYAHRRVRQIAAHQRADNIVAADIYHPDAWITLQQRRSAP